MSYLALARKWRPRSFAELVGQDHISKALINSLNQQKLHHAYLFSGTRGVGKTSIARLFAKALNCEQGISASPCLQCSACQAIEQGRFIDLIEVDAASRTGVDDTRTLLENTQYAASSGRFKIYLIDEVHMLSSASFNALLKTLEEPPEHVKFLLATTDPQKIPVTVLSRCLQFNLKHLPADLINCHLEKILQSEQLAFEPEALPLIAHAARGSMRDALSLLDQCLASMDEHLTTTCVKSVLGYTQQDYALQLLEKLAMDEGSEIIRLSRQIAVEGGHFHYVMEQILHHLHQISLMQILPTLPQNHLHSQALAALAHQISPEDCQLFYEIALKGKEDMDLAPEMSIGFEMTLLRMLAFKPVRAEKDIPQQTKAAEQRHPVASEPKAQANPSPKISENVSRQPVPDEAPHQAEEMSQAIQQVDVFSVPNTANVSDRQTPPAQPAANPAEPTAIIATQEAPTDQSLLVTGGAGNSDWLTTLSQLKLSGLAANAIEHSQLLAKEGNSLQLGVAKGHQSLFTAAVTARIEQSLSNFYGQPTKIRLTFQDQVEDTPSQQKEKNHQERLQNAELALQADPVFQQLKTDFSAELVKKSIMAVENGV